MLSDIVIQLYRVQVVSLRDLHNTSFQMFCPYSLPNILLIFVLGPDVKLAVNSLINDALSKMTTLCFYVVPVLLDLAKKQYGNL